VAVTIRAATLGETAEILSVWQAADAVSSATDDPKGIELLLEIDSGAFLVAVSNDHIVGTLIAAFDGWRGSMYRLAVLPDFRRSGVANDLVAAGEQRLRALGARRLSSLIIEDHSEAVSLWEHCGYERDSRIGRWVKNL
jgi:ribosomal protein S18 acetylase RimI-like enzyme